MKTYEYELYQMEEGLPLFFHDDMVIAGDPANYCAINWHENVELLRINKGEGRVMVGEKLCSVGVGDIIVIPADRLHVVTSDTAVKYGCLILDHEYLEKTGWIFPDTIFLFRCATTHSTVHIRR